MPTSKVKGLDEQLLEGGGSGAGSISGTKWSSLPSKSSSAIGDIKKMMADTSHLKGGAKRSVEEAQKRADKRTATRVVGAAGAGAGAKSMMGDNASAKDSDKKSETVEATFKEVKEESPEAGEMATHYKPDNYKKGGTASSRADGIAQKGKTRGTIVMCGGGMYK